MDELTLTLPRKIRKESQAAVEAAGGTWDPHPSEAVIDRLVERVRPQGQVRAAPGSTSTPTASGCGCGRACASELRRHEPRRRPARAVRADAVRRGDRDAKCFDEGVLTSVADANIGSIFGIGFPAVDRRRGAVRRGLPGRRRPASWPGPTSWPPTYGARFAGPGEPRAPGRSSAAAASPGVSKATFMTPRHESGFADIRGATTASRTTAARSPVAGQYLALAAGARPAGPSMASSRVRTVARSPASSSAGVTCATSASSTSAAGAGRQVRGSSSSPSRPERLGPPRREPQHLGAHRVRRRAAPAGIRGGLDERPDERRR